MKPVQKTHQTDREDIRLVFTGDLFLGGDLLSVRSRQPKSPIDRLDEIRPLFQDADICFVNLEGPIWSPKKPSSQIRLCNDPSVVEFLIQDRFNIVSLANNHIMDFGLEGLSRTISTLEECNVAAVGAGENEAAACRSVVMEIKKRRIGFLAMTTDERDVGSALAGPSSPGCASIYPLDDTIRRIRELRHNVDILCVSLHWGREYYDYPTACQVEIAHQIVNAGANYVVGHHPHVLQGIESYKGSLIIYSLGNLFFSPLTMESGRKLHERADTREFIVVRSNFSTASTLAWEVTGGVKTKQHCLRLYEQSEQLRLEARLRRLSKPLAGRNYPAYWNKYEPRQKRKILRAEFVEALLKSGQLLDPKVRKSITARDIQRNLKRLRNVIWSAGRNRRE